MIQIIHCPDCSSEFVKRVQRITISERLLGFFYIYPFRCQLCDRAFKILQPGIRYVRVDEDRREYRRIRVDLPAWLRKDAIQCEGSAVDISMSGCTVRMDPVLPLDSLVTVGFQIPNETSPLTVKTAIVRNIGQDRIGLEFLQFQGDERHRLRRVVRGMMESAAF